MQTTDDDLYSYFGQQFGRISHAEVKRDPETRTSRGFGFVEFAFPIDAQSAMRFRDHKINGRFVEAKLALPKGFDGQRDDGRKSSLERLAERQQRRGETSSGDIITNKIFVGGLKYVSTTTGLRTAFEKFGVVDSCEVLYDRETQKSRGFGFVVFRSDTAVDAVLDFQRVADVLVDDKRVEVKKCVSKQASERPHWTPSTTTNARPSSNRSIFGFKENVNSHNAKTASPPSRSTEAFSRRPTSERVLFDSNRPRRDGSPRDERYEPPAARAAVNRGSFLNPHDHRVSPHESFGRRGHFFQDDLPSSLESSRRRDPNELLRNTSTPTAFSAPSSTRHSDRSSWRSTSSPVFDLTSLKESLDDVSRFGFIDRPHQLRRSSRSSLLVGGGSESGETSARASPYGGRESSRQSEDEEAIGDDLLYEIS